MKKMPDIVETTHLGSKTRTYERWDKNDLAEYPKVEIDLPVEGDARVLIDGHNLPVTDIKISRVVDELTEVTVTFYANVVGFKATVAMGTETV